MIRTKPVRMCLYIAILFLAVSVTGCGKDDLSRTGYDYDDLSEYIKLAEYKGIEYEKLDEQVSDKEIRDYVDLAVADTGSETENRNGTVEADSVVNIDYTGSLDGTEFDGGAADGVELDIADNNYIPGFAEGIIGHKAGEEFDINVTFPEDYGNEELAGRETVFKIKVNYIVEHNTPEYNDEWVSNNTEHSNVKQYEAAVKEQLLNDRKTDNDNNIRSYVFNQIFDNSEVIEYPKKEYDNMLKKLTDMYRRNAEENDMEFAEYLSEEMGLSEEKFNSLAEKTCQDAVKTELVLYSIANAEKIDLNDKEYDEYLLDLLESSGYTEDEYEEENGISFREYAEENDMYISYAYMKVMDKVMEYSVGK